MTQSHDNSSSPLRPEPEIHPYAYPEMPWSGHPQGWSQAFGRESLHAVDPKAPRQAEEGTGNGHAAQPRGEAEQAEQKAEMDAKWLARIGEETRQAGEKGRREGFALGLERGREESSASLREVRERFLEQGAALASSFGEERSHYFHQAEEELVRLALAIAARVLRREAQMDPLLLTGAARVALGQLAQTTQVRLHVPEADRPLWEEVFARLPNLEHRPSVVSEAEMELGECRIETELGSADLSLWAQLKEIERGFFDRVGVRGVAGEQGGKAEVEETQPARSVARMSATSATGSSARNVSAAQPDGSSPPSARPVSKGVNAAGVNAPGVNAAPVAMPASIAVSSPVPALEEQSTLASMYNEREW